MPDLLRFDALVEVRLRKGIADPQAATIERALPALGFENVHTVHTGKAIRLSVDAPDEAGARSIVERLCDHFLTNPVIEEAAITFEPSS